MPRRRWWVGFVLLAVAVAALFALRAPLLRATVAAIVDVLTGYRVSFGTLALDATTIDARDVHVRRGGDPVLDVGHLVAHYRLNEFVRGGSRRYGLVGLVLEQPTLTLVRHADGGFNVATQNAGAGGGGRAPLIAAIKVTGGRIVLLDPYRTIASTRRITLSPVAATANVDTGGSSSYRGTARVAGDAAARASFAGRIDANGFGVQRARANHLALAPFLNYFINSSSAAVTSGRADDGDVRAYSFGGSTHVVGSVRVVDGAMRIPGLLARATAMNGTIDFYDNGIATQRMGARLGALDATLAGGLFGFDQKAPSFKLGVRIADAPLGRMRELFAFSSHLPLRGNAQLATLVEGDARKPVVATRVASPAAAYGAFPLNDLTGRAIYYAAAVSVVGLRARYGGLALGVDGNIRTGKLAQSELLVAVDGPAARVPYVAQLTPHATLHAIGRIAGDGLALDARALTYGAPPPGTDGDARLTGYVHIDPYGDGTFGPLLATREDGSSVAGTFYLDRARSNSGFWLDARNYAFASFAAAPRLPGLGLVAPQFEAHLDGAIAGLGPPSDFRIAGRVHARDLRIARTSLGDVTGDVTGHLGDVRLGNVNAQGAWGAFAGRGAYVGTRLALVGDYRGSFEALRTFTGDLGAHGPVDGPVALLLDPSRTIVQARSDSALGARVRGVPVDALAGTLAVAGNRLRIYAANARVANGTFAGAGTLANAARGPGDIGVSVAGADAAQLHALVPLDGGGSVATIGRLASDGRATRYDGGVALAGASFQRIPIAASGEVAFENTRLGFSQTTARAGGAVATIGGTLTALGSKRPHYDVNIALADTPLAPLVRAVQPNRRDITGTVEGDFNVIGTTDTLALRGNMSIPEGSIDGLDFRDAGARIDIASDGVGARDGSVTVGSTTVAFGGFFRAGDGGFRIDAPRADLADFNDLFDTGDTLGGRGHIAGRFIRKKGIARTGADVAVAALRYRTFALGDADAHWSSRGTSVTGNVDFVGTSGTLRAAGTLGLATRAPLDQLLGRSRFSGTAHLRGLDLGVWLPAVGYQAPVTGRVDADATIAGQIANPDVRTTATLVGGTIGKLPVDRFAIVATSTLQRTTLQSVELELPSLSLSGSGSFGFGARDPIALRLHAKSPDIAALSARLLGAALPIAGVAEADVSLDGMRTAPRIVGGFDVESAAFHGIAVPRALGEFSVRGRDLVLSDVEVGFTTGTLYVAGSLPLELAPFGFGPARAPIELDLAARNIDVADFAPLFPKGSTLKGSLAGHVSVEGTAGAPRLAGTISLADGAATTPLETQPLTGIRGTLAFDGSAVSLRDLHASAGGGTFDASGTATLADLVSLGANARYRFNARAHNLRLNLPAYGSGVVDGTLALSHVPGTPRLVRGTLTLADGTIPFNALLLASPDSNGSLNATPVLAGRPRASDLAFDLNIAADRNVRVRSANVDIGGQGAIHVGGTNLAPQLSGGFDSTGGTLTYFNTVFRVIEGRVTFEPDLGVIPVLNARAVTHVIDPDPNTIRNLAGSADVSLDIHGPVTNLTIGLSSNPQYDREQILGLLFNAPALGATNLFGDTPGQATLYGTNSPNALPRDVAASRNASGQLTVAQEAFGVANAQFTRTLLAPIESTFASAVGLTNFNVNVDYTGNVGVQARKVLGKQLSAVYGTTFGYPYRQTFGFELKPNAVTAAQVTVFQTFGATGLTSLNPAILAPNYTNPRIGAAQPSAGSVGFSLSLQRLFP